MLQPRLHGQLGLSVLLLALTCRHATCMRDDDTEAALSVSDISARTNFEEIASTILQGSHDLDGFKDGQGPKMCEDVMKEGGKWADLLAEAGRNYTQEEAEAAFAELNLGDSAPGGGATCKEHPRVVFFLGPPSVGKGTSAAVLQATFGFGLTKAKKNNVVLVDVQVLAKHHKGLKALREAVGKQKCMYELSDQMMDSLFEVRLDLLKLATQASCRRNLLIPITCSNFRKCLQNINLFKSKGYTVSQVAVYAPRQVVDERGQSKSQKTGVPYNRSMFVPSIAAFLPVMASSNGRCLFVDNTDKPKVTQNLTCLNQTKFEPSVLQNVSQEWHDMASKVLQVTGLSAEEFKEAEEEMGIFRNVTAPEEHTTQVTTLGGVSTTAKVTSSGGDSTTKAKAAAEVPTSKPGSGVTGLNRTLKTDKAIAKLTITSPEAEEDSNATTTTTKGGALRNCRGPLVAAALGSIALLF